MLENHIKDIKADKEFMAVLPSQRLTDMVVLGENTLAYWVQRPDELLEYETEICTVQELIECLKSANE